MISLRLPQATERRLTAHARKLGKTRTEIVRKSIEEFLDRTDSLDAQGDLVSDLIAALPDGPGDLAQNRKNHLTIDWTQKHAKRRPH